jgi:hypothetical protein
LSFPMVRSSCLLICASVNKPPYCNSPRTRPQKPRRKITRTLAVAFRPEFEPRAQAASNWGSSDCLPDAAIARQERARFGFSFRRSALPCAALFALRGMRGGERRRGVAALI